MTRKRRASGPALSAFPAHFQPTFRSRDPDTDARGSDIFSEFRALRTKPISTEKMKYAPGQRQNIDNQTRIAHAARQMRFITLKSM